MLFYFARINRLGDFCKKSKKMSQSQLSTQSFNFALKVISLTKALQENQKEFILSKQFLRSGTSIGALIREAQFAQSRADFINKLSISLKESNESLYWIELISKSYLIYENNCYELSIDCNNIKAMLISSVKTAKKNL